MGARIFFLVLAVGCWWTYQTYHVGDGPGDELPAVSADGAAAAEGAGLRRLWANAPAEPAADRVVLCRRGAESEYLRDSECALRGGRVDEPAWARVD